MTLDPEVTLSPIIPPYFVITDGAGRRFLGRKANMYLEYMSPQGGNFSPFHDRRVEYSQLAPRGCPLENGATSGSSLIGKLGTQQ